MNTTIHETDGTTVAVLEGRLDTAASPDAERALQPLYHCENRAIVLDCSKLHYISSSGLRLFLSVLKSAKPRGCRVYISGLNADLRQVFAMTGFINLFEFK
jgi:anti-anti-sigma factor